MSGDISIIDQIRSFLIDMHTQSPEWTVSESERLLSLLDNSMADLRPMAIRMLDFQPFAHRNSGMRLWQILEDAGLPTDEQEGVIEFALKTIGANL
jgi:hypothetical protein